MAAVGAPYDSVSIDPAVPAAGIVFRLDNVLAEMGFNVQRPRRNLFYCWFSRLVL
jgi:hypothetical protein